MEYWFDEAEAERAVAFYPMFCRHVKGPLAGKPFELLPWQQKVIRDVFGWKRPDGTRRYRTVFVMIPRKNGKSFLASGLALYMLMADGEEGGEVYSAAGSRDQASLVYSMAADIVRGEEHLEKRLKIRDSVKRIMHPASNSFYRAIPAEAATAHGFNASAIIFDEVHTQPNRELWDVLTTSTGARSQPLTFAITTAGHDRSSICYELFETSKRILDGTLVDDSFYPVLFYADDEADWTDPQVWRDSNPSIGHGVSEEYLASQCQKAKESASYENTFRNLHLNQWTEQEVRWLQMDAWDKCEDEKRPDTTGRPCYMGLDLANTRDVNALLMVWDMGDGGFWMEPRFWVPRDAKDTRNEVIHNTLQNWASSGYIERTDGQTTSYAQIAEQTLKLMREHDVQQLAFDPYGPAPAVTNYLLDEGVDEDRLVVFQQSLKNFAGPTLRFEELLASGKMRHDGNPVLRWMAGNVVVRPDSNNNIRPDKGRSSEKIDGIVAAIMGLALALNRQVIEDESTIYDSDSLDDDMALLI